MNAKIICGCLQKPVEQVRPELPPRLEGQQCVFFVPQPQGRTDLLAIMDLSFLSGQQVGSWKSFPRYISQST